MNWSKTMGRRGPQPKPTALKVLEGNPGCYRLEPTGIDALGRPYTPDHLCDDAAGCIDVIQQSMPAHVFSALDTFLLSAYATAWSLHKRAVLAISGPDFNLETHARWIRLANQQAAIMASLGDRLGLDPRSRAALKLPNAKQQKSKFHGLLGQPTMSLPS
jgi:phage terminase small subunit